MTDAISPKLLVLLALSVIVAGVGGWRLLSADDTAADVGFGPETELPIEIAPTTGAAELSDEIADVFEDTGRNPFARADGGETFTPADTGSDGDNTDSDGDDTGSDGDDTDNEAADAPSTADTPVVTEPAPPVTTAPAVAPVFPNPDLVDQAPSRGDGRSLEG